VAQPLRKLLGIVALALGLSLSVGAANASAAPRSTVASDSATYASVTHAAPRAKHDWWW